jgi:hypothetical protein
MSAISAGVYTPWFDVKRYGAVGDGVTDDAAAIQALLTAVPTGSRVYLPPATYALSTGLSWSGKAVTLEGAGPEGTFLLPTGAIHTISLNVAGGSKDYGSIFRNFSIGTASDRAAGSGIRLGNVGEVLIDNVKVTNALGGRVYKGLLIEAASGSHFRRLHVSGCASNGVEINVAGTPAAGVVDLWFEASCLVNANQGHGIYLEATSATQTLEGIYLGPFSVYGNAGDGVNVNTGAGAFIRHLFLGGTLLDSNSGNGLILQGSGTIQRTHLTDAWVSFNGDASGDHGIALTAACFDTEIKTCHILTNYHCGILDFGGTRTTIRGSGIWSNNRGVVGAYGVQFSNNAVRPKLTDCEIFNDPGRSEVQNGVIIDAGVTDARITDNDLDTGTGTTRFSNAGTRTRHWNNVTDESGLGPNDLAATAKWGTD